MRSPAPAFAFGISCLAALPIVFGWRTNDHANGADF
jgi:hypothetical protein